MKRFLIGVAMASTVAVAGCASPGGVSPQVTEARGLAAAWASLDAVAITLDGLATSKVLRGPAALTAAKDLQLATDALTAADSAYRAGDQGKAAGKVAQATALITALVTIASQNGGK